MKEQLITFKTAKLAKEKGLMGRNDDGRIIEDMYLDCNYFYDPENHIPKEDAIHHSELSNYVEGVGKRMFYAPTQSLLQKWLREKHNIIVTLNPTLNVFTFSYIILTKGSFSGTSDIIISKKQWYWEQALEKGLQKALKLIK